jgi:hypothetical protein
MWRLTEHSWAIAITTAIISALWIYGPVGWVVWQNPELTATDFYAFVKASMQYKYFLCLSFLPLTCLICVVFSYHFLPRIRTRENVVVKQMCEQNKALQAELNSQKDILDKAALAHEDLVAELHRREAGFKVVMGRFWEDLDSSELAINTDRAKADEFYSKLSALENELDSRARSIEIKVADLKRREQNLLPLEKQLADLKTSIQSQAIEVQESLTNAKKQAVTILDQAKQDAQITVLRAEADAADVIEGAAQEAREMVSQARAQCKDLWGWCHYKAHNANATPEDWQEVKRLRQESRKLRQVQDDGLPGDNKDGQREAVTKEKFEISGRQVLALNHIREHGNLTIQDFEKICPDVNRRTLQRDLKAMVDSGILFFTGASNQLIYHLAKSCDIATANLRHG